MMFAPVVLSAAIWAWLLVGHGQFWRSGPVLQRRRPAGAVKVTVVIPARNEAEHIGATLRSLLAQDVDGELRVILVDDNSSDGTGAIAQQMADEDGRLRVVHGAALEAGWSGKLWAVAQGLAQPEALRAAYVLLTDADIVHGPGHVGSLVAHAEGGGFGLVSEMVRLRCEEFAERATLPAFVFFFQMLYPFRWVNDPLRRTAAAAGGTMLVSQAALRSVEGVNRIRGALIDDVALAREVKAEGHRIWLGHGEEVESQRRYLELSEVWEMIARTAYVQLEYSPVLLLGTCAGMAVIYVQPVLASLFAKGWPRYVGVACWAVMALAFQPTLRRYKRSPLWGVVLPVIAVFYLGATVASAMRFYKGRGWPMEGPDLCRGRLIRFLSSRTERIAGGALPGSQCCVDGSGRDAGPVGSEQLTPEQPSDSRLRCAAGEAGFLSKLRVAGLHGLASPLLLERDPEVEKKGCGAVVVTDEVAHERAVDVRVEREGVRHAVPVASIATDSTLCVRARGPYAGRRGDDP